MRALLYVTSRRFDVGLIGRRITQDGMRPSNRGELERGVVDGNARDDEIQRTNVSAKCRVVEKSLQESRCQLDGSSRGTKPREEIGAKNRSPSADKNQ